MATSSQNQLDGFDRMAYNYGSIYPPYYVPEPWRTTYVPRHFPEQHYPLEHIRHTLGHTIGSVANNVAGTLIHPFGSDPPIHTPAIDIRESKQNYYLDIELPGVGPSDKFKIRWVTSQTLLLETKIERPEIVEDEATDVAASAEPPKESNDKPDIGEKDRATSNAKGGNQGKDTALTVHERRLGSFARAFSFPTAVSHEKLEAHLQDGLLRIKVPRKDVEDVKPEHKEVEVKYGGT